MRVHFLLSGFAIIVLIVCSNNACNAAEDIDQLLSGTETSQSTSTEQAVAGNPIKLTITKEAPSGDLQVAQGDLSLSQAVDLGVKNNFSLRQNEQSWIGSKFDARAVLGRFGPSVSFSTFFASSSIDQMLFYQSGEISPSPMQPVRKGTGLFPMFSATQPLFTSGRLMGNYKAARARERQTLAELRANRIATALRVKQAYWNAAWGEATLRVASDYVKFRQWSSSNMKERVTEGKAPPADYLREKAELSRAQIALNDAYRDYNTALLNLKYEMAVNVSSLIGVKDRLEYVETSGTLNDYLLQAGKNRPELAQAASKVAEMKAKRLVAMSKYGPQVNLYGLTSNATGSAPGIENSVSGRWGGMVSVIGGITLFDSGTRLNELRSVRAAVRQAEIGQQETGLKVARDVSQAWIDLDLARRNVEIARAQVVSAEEDYRLFHARYLVGKAIALEEFDAAVRMFQARRALLEAIYKYRLGQAQIVWASGGM